MTWSIRSHRARVAELKSQGVGARDADQRAYREAAQKQHESEQGTNGRNN